MLILLLLSYSAGPVFSSFSAEFLALVHGLEWCHSHLKSCHFQSALYLTDSQSPLTLLSRAPVFLQPKSFWDVWDLSNSLSYRVALSFQWVFGHAGLPGNELADSLAKTGATLPFTHVSCPLARPLQRFGPLTTRFRDKIFLTTPSPARFLWFLGETGPSSFYLL